MRRSARVPPVGSRLARPALMLLGVVACGGPVLCQGAPAPPPASASAPFVGTTSTANEPVFRRPDARFSIRVGRIAVRLRVLAIGVLAGARIEIGPGPDASSRLSASDDQGSLDGSVRRGWTWTAPGRPGFYAVRLVDPVVSDTIRLTFMVLRPASDMENGRLNGYRIGAYRSRPASMSAAYEPPRGFIEARPEDYDIPLSPNFRLGQFLCKDPGNPRYLLVTPRLLIKLEALLVAVNDAGYTTPSLTVMSGFRTPTYNRAIGNATDFSRHLWGDAADVFVDADGNGQMDDLNGDGRSDVRDARWLADVVERIMLAEDPGLAPGGLSIYRRNAAHGPFVHMDTRGRRARW